MTGVWNLVQKTWQKAVSFLCAFTQAAPPSVTLLFVWQTDPLRLSLGITPPTNTFSLTPPLSALLPYDPVNTLYESRSLYVASCTTLSLPVWIVSIRLELPEARELSFTQFYTSSLVQLACTGFDEQINISADS